MIGTTVSHYRIIKRLGEGGMGIVYLAEDTVLGRQVAIKTLTEASGPGHQHFRTRFLREARAVSALSHPHIATVHDYGETPDGQPYIVMEFIRGETLADLMLKESLTIPRALQIISEVAEALGEAHAHGIIHRDIKPSNVAINHRGEVKVLDFGLAKQIEPAFADSLNPERQTLLNTQTREGVIVGTPMYLSPEQALGVEVDARSDLFSLGALLYECLAGKPPFFGGGAMEICAKVIRDDPIPPSQINSDVPQELDRIVLKALAKKPADRYQTGSEMVDDLEAVRTQVRGFEQPITRTMTASPGTQRTGALATLSDIFKRPRVSVGYAIAAAAVIAALVLLVWYLNKATPHEPSAEVRHLYDLGVAALREGTYYKASKLLGEVVKQDDNFILGHARLAEVWAELDYSDKAKTSLIKVNGLTRDQVLTPVDEIYLQAINLKLTGDSGGAIEKFGVIADQAASHEQAAAYVDLARAHERDGNAKKAKEFYLRAREIDPRSTAAVIRLGVLYSRQLDQESTNIALAAFDEARGRYQTVNDVEGEAEVLYERGVFYITRRKLPEARSELSQALSKSDAIGNKYQQVKIRLQLSSVSCLEGDTTKALQEANEVIQFAKENGLENLAANALINLGNALMARGDFAQAESSLNQSLELAQYYKARRSEGKALLVLASFYTQHQGNAAKVRDLVDRAATINRQEGHRKYTLQALAILGHANDQVAEYDAATKAFGQQQVLAEQLQDQEQVGLANEGIGIALAHQQRYAESLAHLNKAASISRNLGLPPNELHAELNRANVLWRLGQYPEAEKALNFVKGRLSQSPNSELEAWTYLFQAQMALSRNQTSPAIDAASKALALSAQEFHEIALESKATLCLAYADLGMLEKAKQLCTKPLETSKISDPRLRALALLARSVVLGRTDEPQLALVAALEAQSMFERMGQLDDEWQAWLSAALAEQELTGPKSNEFAARAAGCIIKLEELLGPEARILYAARPDVRRARERLKSEFARLNST